MAHDEAQREVSKTWLAIVESIRKAIEFIAIRRSMVGRTPFFDKQQFSFAEPLESAAEEIIDEYERMARRIGDFPGVEDLAPWNREVTSDKSWKTFTLRTYDGSVSPLAQELCPIAMRALAAIPQVRLANFSILEPGTRLSPHRGPYKGILRCHLGIRVPRDRERCKIRVDREWRSWERGKVMLFDDSFEHEVINDTDERRVVLFIDFVRPLAAPFTSINEFLITKLLDKTEVTRTFSERQRAWEASVRKALIVRGDLPAAGDDLHAAAE